MSAVSRASRCSALLLLVLALTAADGRIVDYTLDIAETTLSPAGTPVTALTINGGVPGPVLRFTVGDTAHILVRNRLASETTSIHWHGLLVPNSEDGVPLTTTPIIHPGESRHFSFPLTHAGTYWYHSHSDLQEQRGLYGAIVVLPREPRIAVDRDEVLLLSDWTNEHPDEVMRTLMRGSDWYSIRKGTAQSIVGAIRAGHLGDYLNREKARLPPMDVSDVAYDAFLVNGQRRVAIDAKPGERVRLRVINAGAATYFYLHAASGPLTIIAADGNDVEPIQQRHLLMGIAETYDLLFTVPPDGAWELRATAQDTSGYASAFIGSGTPHPAAAMAPIDPYSMNQAMATILDQLDETGTLTDEQALAQEPERPLPPYKRLRAVAPTSLPTDAPVRTLTMHLTGDMQRYIWSLDGKTMGEEDTIPVHRGEVLRLELVNDTMMHHPMHLHGHFVRLLMPGGPDPAFAPLKHTVDVPPMSRRTIEFLANEHGDWLFHCHVLYHHISGMARVVSYDDQGPTHQVQMEEHQPFHPMLDASLLSNMTLGTASLMGMRNDLNLAWEAGWKRVDSPQYEIDLTGERYINPRWSIYAGVRDTTKADPERGLVHGRGATVDLGDDGLGLAIAGFRYRLPYNVVSDVTLTSAGEVRLGLAKALQITDRLSAPLRISYDSEERWQGQAGLSYTITKPLSVIALWDRDYGWGAGITVRF